MKTVLPFTFLALFSIGPLLAEESAFLQNSRQLTFDGARAGEGYFNADGTKLIFQSERDEANPFFQIFVMDLETGDLNQVSPGTGKTTCAWIHPGGEKVMFSSTHADPKSEEFQREELHFRKSGKEKRYSWDYDEAYDIYEAGMDGANLTNLTNALGYDAEGSYSSDGKRIAFASNRHAYTDELTEGQKAAFEENKSALMDIYIMDADGGNVRRLTDVDGYDGGPFFSADGTKICWRRFSEDGATAEIYTMNVDGSGQKAITKIGAMSWAPYFHPSGEYLIFATNKHGFANFELYLVDASGEKEPVRVTDTDGFDGLPAFSPDGKRLSWTSNRTSNRKSQIFIADWNHEAAREALGLSGPELPKTSPEISADDLKKHLTYLASDELEGRLTGTEGERKATEYAAQVFKSYGLEPAGDDRGWYQSFEFTAGVDLGTNNALKIAEGFSTKLNEDWRPLAFSSIGEIEAAGVVFAGYGMEVPEGQGEDGKKYELYSSYFHLDVKDKWVLMFRYMPENVAPELRRRFARHSSLRYKALTARQKGAKGIIVMSGPNSQVKSELVPLSYDASMAGSGVAAISVSNALAEQMMKAGGETRELKEIQSKLDTGEMMAGVTLKEVSVSAVIDITQEKRVGRNVIARLKSNGGSRAPIVIGAHIDHLGAVAGATSRSTDEDGDQIHHGADDNASGTSALFEIAEYLSGQKTVGKLKMERDAIFAAWSGEEIGLLGSAHYVRELANELGGSPDAKLTGKLSACLNMDMIGRLDKSLVLQGIGSSKQWKSEIEQRNAPVGLSIVTQDDAYLPTDATSFYLKGVPILNAFTGSHEDYHKPSDTADKIDYEGAQEITRFMALVARGLIVSSTEPAYEEMMRPEEKGTRTGLRAYLGTVPDYAQGDVIGVKLSGVTKGAPADTAGLKGGDVIIKLAGKELKNIYDYTYIIEALKIGTEVDIEVKRGEEVIKSKITPGSRD